MKVLDLNGLSIFKEKIIEKIPTKISELNNDFGYTKVTNSDTNGYIYTEIENSKTHIPVYTLPTATSDLLGGVKVDGSTITISDGVISAVSSGGVGEDVSGDRVTFDGSNVNCGNGAEIFNCYADGLTQSTGMNESKNKAIGVYSHAEGATTMSSGNYSHAEGRGTKSTGTASHAEGYNTTASGINSHAEGNGTSANGSYSHAEGYESVVSATATYGGHAEGYSTTASGEKGSHAEGYCSTASGSYSHAEGYYSTASGSSSHTEGGYTKATNYYSHAEGNSTTAEGSASHAEGSSTLAHGSNSHSEGSGSKANGYASHAEGNNTIADGQSSHAEGLGSSASGSESHAEGYYTTASGSYSHAAGSYTTALNYQYVIGHYNDTTTAIANSYNVGAGNGTAFVIGNGWSSSDLSNAFRVTYSGNVYAVGTTINTGADYAEYFEWEDGNIDNEDRVGYFVTLNDQKIKKATSEDYILGVVSGTASIIGNGDECWRGKFIHDDFGRLIYETVDDEYVETKSLFNEDTNETEYIQEVKTRTISVPKINPNYNKNNTYIQRADRKEWSAVGMLGVVYVRDDGTCKVNEYCKCNNGIATYTKHNDINSYRVIKRITNNIIQIVLK